ncbi:hypothetical protein ACS0TY_026555 [Phlomoides rotata]
MDLNNDIVIEILLCLPVKSLLRFRSVCKFWCNLIDSSAFRKSHFHNQSTNNHNYDEDTMFLQFTESAWTLSSALFPNYWKSYNDFPPEFQKFLNDSIKESRSWVAGNLIFYGPINGLILMYNRIPVWENESCVEWSLCIAICNPCLGEIKILPPSPIFLSLLHSCKTWDEAFNFRDVGFGFDNLTKDYKVVQLICTLKGDYVVEVYSGRSNTWRVVVTDMLDDHRSCGLEKMAIKCVTTAYWRMFRRSESGDLEEVLLSFNIKNEVFEMIRLPLVVLYSTVDDMVLYAKDDDSLVLFVSTCEFDRLEQWELNKERGWTHVKNVNIRLYEGGLPPKPIALWKDGGLVLSCFLPNDNDDNWFYNNWFNYCILHDSSTEEEEETKCIVLPKDRLEVLEYKCTLYSLEMEKL